MSNPAARGRLRATLWLAAAAMLAIGLAAIAMLPPPAEPVRKEVGASVAPGFAEKAAGVALIKVTTEEETYSLVRGAEGWSEPERGGYKIASGRIDELMRAIAGMKYAAPMTRDEKKFDRIGLGDPVHGGAGALLEIGDGKDAGYFKLIVGYRDGRTYVREPDDLQAWAVSDPAGEAMPPLQRGARWLDLSIVSVQAPDIREVEVHLAGATPYKLLAKDATGQQFTLAPPYDARHVVASFAPTLPGQALTRFAPIDVAKADSLKGAKSVADHLTRTRSGLEITVTSLKQGDHGWAMVSAKAAPGAAAEAVSQAEAINARAAGWAFALSGNDWSAFATPIEAIVEPKGYEPKISGPPL